MRTMPPARCSRPGAAMPRPAMRPIGWCIYFAPRSKRAHFSCSLRPRAGRRRTSTSKSRLPSKAPCGAWCSSVPRICWRRIIPTGTPSFSRPSSRAKDCRRRAAASTRARWGDVNAVRVAHPLSAAVPLFAALLDMPTVKVAGGRHDMPRIQGPDYGASERFSVAPGHEERGLLSKCRADKAAIRSRPSTARALPPGSKGGPRPSCRDRRHTPCC